VPNSVKGESIENLFLISAIIIGFGRNCCSTEGSGPFLEQVASMKRQKSSRAMINLPLEYLKRNMRPGRTGTK